MFVVICLSSSISLAESGFDIVGKYMFGWGASGTLVGDMQGGGFYGTYKVNENWKALFSLSHYAYDLEEPITRLSIHPRPADKPKDNFITVTEIEIGGEYGFSKSTTGMFISQLGLSYFMFDARQANGTTTTNQAFSISVDAPNSLAIFAKFGYSFNLYDGLHLDTLVRYAQAFNGWTATDSVSGQTGSISPYSPLGLTVRLGYSF